LDGYLASLKLCEVQVHQTQAVYFFRDRSFDSRTGLRRDMRQYIELFLGVHPLFGQHPLTRPVMRPLELGPPLLEAPSRFNSSGMTELK
jgi:hypothetical protein